MDIFKMIRQKKAIFLLAQLIMSSFYRRLGEKLGVLPGAEMIEGIDLAEKTGAELVLADRDIEITLKRVWGYLGSGASSSSPCSSRWESSFRTRLTPTDRGPQAEGPAGKHDGGVRGEVPADQGTSDRRAGHLPGAEDSPRPGPEDRGGRRVTVTSPASMARLIPGRPHAPTKALMELPPKSIWPKIIAWAVPILILVSLARLRFHERAAEQRLQEYLHLDPRHGQPVRRGAALALAHPLTIISAFLAAPITTLHPLLAAGWIAGLVQAFIKKPQRRRSRETCRMPSRRSKASGPIP